MKQISWLKTGIAALLLGIFSNTINAEEPAAAKTPGPVVTENRLPDLAWEKRSDWQDVTAPSPKTPDAPVAKGDGKTDDTAALQAAFDRLSNGETMYLPAGTYRITKTLEALPVDSAGKKRRIMGVTVLGHGRSTVIVWDGPVGGSMFCQKTGWPLTRFVGLTWDGRGKAAIGQEITTKKRFETENQYKHCAYLNFTKAGFSCWYKRTYASAETIFENCYFANCTEGIALLTFNVLDYVILGCEFRGCGTGILGAKGTNFYARECNFFGSTKADVVFRGEHGASVRRCTSKGSQRFAIYGSHVSPLVIQDCRVDGWKDASGAVLLEPEYAAPLVLFDNVFTTPPSDAAPVVCHNKNQRLIVSNNQATGCKSVLADNKFGMVYEIPAGKRQGVMSGPDQSFFRTTVAMPSKIFDAKRDFGAKGDGKTDDTEAVQKTIDAARKHAKGALAYFPQGSYRVNKPIRVTGADYTVGGNGNGTALTWGGAPEGHTLEVQDTQRVVIEAMAIGHHNFQHAPCHANIVQLPSKNGSTVCYDRVRAFGMYAKKPLQEGFRAKNLGPKDRIYFKEFNGNICLTDSADATIFLGTTWEGTIIVEGKDKDRSGFIGGGVRLATICDPGLWIKDNHSIVYSDFYTESGQQIIRLEGDATLPAGRVVLQGPKFEISPESEKNDLEATNYKGDVILGSYLFYPGDGDKKFHQTGDAPFSLTFWASCFYQTKSEINLAKNANLYALGNHHLKFSDKAGATITSTQTGIADTKGKEASARVSLALDDLRRLGQIEMEFAFGDLFMPKK